MEPNVAAPSPAGRLALPPHEPAGRPPAAPPPSRGGLGWKPFAVGAGVLLVGGALFATGLVPRLRDRSAVKTDTAPDGPAPVNIVVVKPAPAEMDVVLPGAARADEETSVLARTNGYLEKWLVDIGDKVAENQLMGVIATPEVDQELQQNKATVLQARASVLQAQANLEQAKATRVVNKANFERADKLTKSGALTQQEFDTAEANLRTSEANVASGVAAVGVATANVGVAEANVRRLEDLVAFKQVKAPFAGVVTARSVDTGALISAGQAAATATSAQAAAGGSGGSGTGAGSGAAGGTAQALFRVARTDPLRIFVNVPQVFTPYVRVGSKSEVRVREFPGRPFPGTVSRTANSLDPSARTLTTEVLVRNPDGKLLPGMYVQVKFSQHRDKPPVLVPGGALITRNDAILVAVVGDGDKLDYRTVVVGRDFGTTAEVVQGLSGGERVAVNLVEEPPAGTTVKPVVMPDDPGPKK